MKMKGFEIARVLIRYGDDELVIKMTGYPAIARELGFLLLITHHFLVFFATGYYHVNASNLRSVVS
jgi:hypothetical protein